MIEIIKRLFCGNEKDNFEIDCLRYEEEKVKRIKMETNKKSEKILDDFIKNDGKYAWEGKPWGHLVKEFIIDDVSYYLVKKEEGAYESIYIINYDTASLYKHGTGTASHLPFVEWSIEEENDAFKVDRTLKINEIHTFEFQNRGLGTVLIQSVIKVAEDRECVRIVGELSSRDIVENDDVTIDKNKQAHRQHFYEKNGFIVKEDDKGNGLVSREII